MAMAFLMEAPQAPAPAPKAGTRVQHVDLVKPEMQGGQIFAPTAIPTAINMIAEGRRHCRDNNVAADGRRHGRREQSISAMRITPGGAQQARPGARLGHGGWGLLIQKMFPVYPAIAGGSQKQGTVVLQATISRNGTIENLRVASGPAMLHRQRLTR